jgi:hypothetical protein
MGDRDFRRTLGTAIACSFLWLSAIGCTRSDPTRLKAVSIAAGDMVTPAGNRAPIRAEEGQTLYTLTATLPDAITPDRTWRQPVLIDDAGAEYRFITSSINTGSSAPAVFSATFSLPDSRSPVVVRIGNHHINFVNSTIVDLRKPRQN